MDIGEIILASQSPRRKQLLEQIGMKFKAVTSEVEEDVANGTTPREMVAILAKRKAKAVQEKFEPEDIIIGADTVVSYDGMILGKPEHESDMFQMLAMLSGNWHKVYTGLCVLRGDKEVVKVVRTRVKFAELSEQEIECYIKTGEPMDKAGGYAVQGRGAAFVEEIEGDYFNVVGLPLHALCQILKNKFGYSICEDE